ETSIGFFNCTRRYSHHSRSSPGPTVYGAVRIWIPCFGFRRYGFAPTGATNPRMRKLRSRVRIQNRYAATPGHVQHTKKNIGPKAARDRRRGDHGTRPPPPEATRRRLDVAAVTQPAVAPTQATVRRSTLRAARGTARCAPARDVRVPPDLPRRRSRP